ncbi:hypothetical protein HanOQP8_Chr10g0371991 [Helianthus annuus]|nr:hypothetical protein HanOQP8_Chr10g0371991 [Helianthus annuus]
MCQAAVLQGLFIYLYYPYFNIIFILCLENFFTLLSIIHSFLPQVSFSSSFSFLLCSIMGALKDLARSFSRMTQEEVDLFCLEYGIDKKFNPTAPSCDVSVDKPIPGSIALYCRHFQWSNLRYPFSFFVLNLLEYYRVSFGQVHPKGMARVLHFEVLCRALGYDPSLLLFRRFFRLAKNGDWFTFETTKVDTCLISSMVTTLGSWKDTFF